jgi:hypothetical protein
MDDLMAEIKKMANSCRSRYKAAATAVIVAVSTGREWWLRKD